MQADSPAPDTIAVADTLAARSINVGDAAGGLVGKLEAWFEGFVALLPNLVVAVLMVVAAVWLARNPAAAGSTFRGDAVLVAPGRWPRHVPDAFPVPIG